MICQEAIVDFVDFNTQGCEYLRINFILTFLFSDCTDKLSASDSVILLSMLYIC